MAHDSKDSGWYTSSYSNGGGDACVQCRIAAGQPVGVRDSKNPGGGTVWFAPAAWHAFLGRATTGGQRG